MTSWKGTAFKHVKPGGSAVIGQDVCDGCWAFFFFRWLLVAGGHRVSDSKRWPPASRGATRPELWRRIHGNISLSGASVWQTLEQEHRSREYRFILHLEKFSFAVMLKNLFQYKEAWKDSVDVKRSSWSHRLQSRKEALYLRLTRLRCSCFCGISAALFCSYKLSMNFAL